MKKSLLLLVLSFVSFSEAQTLYVKKLTEVKVKPGALVYVDGNMVVESGLTDRANTPNAGYVSNEGNIKITQNLEMKNNANGSDFVNELLPGGVYGQLIVKNGGTNNSGDIASHVAFNKEFGYYPFSFPFTNSRPFYLVADIFALPNDQKATTVSAWLGYTPGRGGNTQRGFDRERYKNPLFVAGQSQQVLDNVLISERNIQLGAYYVFNKNFSGLKTLTLPEKSIMQGTPNKNDVSVTVNKYKITNSKGYNKYGEQFGSYVIDFTKNMPAGFDKYGDKDAVVAADGFGDNIFFLGNPFTSNINLFGDTNNQTFKQVSAIVQFKMDTDYNESVNLDTNSGDISTSYGRTMDAATGDATGDATALYVRPYQTFAVKLKESAPNTYTFKFTDGMKTFDLPTTDAPLNTMLDITARNSNAKRADVNQVGLDLYDASDRFTGVKTYVVASDIYEASKKGKGVELTNIAIEDKDTALYTLQEDENGSVDESLADEKAYINGVNANKYVGKPIHLVLQNGKGTYTFKVRLNKDLLKNKNTFYFEDKKTGDVLKVNKDFKYTFNAEGTDKDRFVLYWAKTPKDVLDKEVVKEVAEQSNFVYKDAIGTHKVRFNKSAKKADVFVYSISGQLVNVAKGVNTSEDYIVPVKGNSSIYVVKIVDENGKITTQKIVK